jgi:hypothetical protein
MKTIKELADELGVDKQKVYRYIKKNHIKEVNQECISETCQRNNVKYYDEVAESLIKQGFCGDIESNEIHQEAHREHINDTMIDTLLKQIEMLKSELDVKNEQIKEKDKQLSDTLKALDQAQQLQAMAESKVQLLEEKQEEEKVVKPEQEEHPSKRWWNFWR